MWYHIWSESAKNHFVHDSLLEGLKADMEKRGHKVYKAEPTTRGWFDLPGMIQVGRSYEKFTLDGLEFTVAAENFEYMFNELRTVHERTFVDGKKYYKIHGWLHCPVFTPEQRTTLLNYMEGEMKRVMAVAEIEHQQFVDVINDINKDGINVVTPKAPKSMKAFEQKVLLSGKPTKDKN